MQLRDGCKFTGSIAEGTANMPIEDGFKLPDF